MRNAPEPENASPPGAKKMFCPLCNAEYREGFTRCNDCEVALVDRLDLPGSDDRQSALAAPQKLWEGRDAAFFTRLIAALADAKIPYHEGDTSARLLYRSLQPPHSVWTLSKDKEAALQVLKSISGSEDESSETSTDVQAQADELSLEESAGPPVDDIVEDFYPEDATAEVWRGESNGAAEMFRDCFLENGIGCVIDDPSPDEQCLRVLPRQEDRARKIIREIVEGTPPE
ncbi:MAG: hypothetical protein ACRD4K_05980 [Candidatus Acidiferrales bacterium]